VGEFVNEHFVSTHQKVGTFRIVNGQKQGGNVACYFCRPDGTVVHAVAGQVKADVLLAEAHFAVELDKLARLHGGKSTLKNKLTVAEEHQKRVKFDVRAARGDVEAVFDGFAADDQFLTKCRGMLTAQGQVSALLMRYPLPTLDQFYPLVWERVLKEKQNVAPVAVK
jgi:hypothetical protein